MPGYKNSLSGFSGCLILLRVVAKMNKMVKMYHDFCIVIGRKLMLLVKAQVRGYILTHIPTQNMNTYFTNMYYKRVVY